MEFDRILKGPIDDNKTNYQKTWSSGKIRDEINKVSASVFKTTVASWASDPESGLFKATITHNLETKDIIITSYNTTLQLNELISYKIIDENSIELIAEDQDSIDVTIYSKLISAISISPDKPETGSANINDNSIELTSTWSSDKISKEINVLKTETDKIENISKQVSDMSTNVEKIPNMSKSIESLTKETNKISGIETSINNLTQETNKISGMETSLKSLSQETSKISGIESDISALNKSVEKIPTIESSISTLKTETNKIGTITTDISNLQKELNQLKLEVQGNKEAMVNNVNSLIDSI